MRHVLNEPEPEPEPEPLDDVQAFNQGKSQLLAEIQGLHEQVEVVKDAAFSLAEIAKRDATLRLDRATYREINDSLMLNLDRPIRDARRGRRRGSRRDVTIARAALGNAGRLTGLRLAQVRAAAGPWQCGDLLGPVRFAGRHGVDVLVGIYLDCDEHGQPYMLGRRAGTAVSSPGWTGTRSSARSATRSPTCGSSAFMTALTKKPWTRSRGALPTSFNCAVGCSPTADAPAAGHRRHAGQSWSPAKRRARGRRGRLTSRERYADVSAKRPVA